MKKIKFATKAIHIGNSPDPVTGAITSPIFMTSTFVQEAPGKDKGYDYTRANNPNFTRLEETLASLENAKYATVFSSGLGALTGLISTLSQGDRVLGIHGLYGGTYRLFKAVFSRFGIDFKLMELNELESALALKPKWLFFETPTNPLLDIYDIALLAQAAKKHGVRTLVDNTFASSYFQSPLNLGVDAVWHSTTKYTGGHSDVIGGAIMTDDATLYQQLNFARMALGVNPSPFDVWLLSRGVKTLAVRMEQHQRNAMAIAQYLEAHPKVKRVIYPGLQSHPGHAVAKKQMRGFGGMIAVEFHFSLEHTKQLIASLKLFSLAESLGGVESLICHPSTMTHASIPQAERIKMGITDSLVRISVGIEDIDDLVHDLETALRD